MGQTSLTFIQCPLSASPRTLALGDGWVWMLHNRRIQCNSCASGHTLPRQLRCSLLCNNVMSDLLVCSFVQQLSAGPKHFTVGMNVQLACNLCDCSFTQLFGRQPAEITQIKCTQGGELISSQTCLLGSERFTEPGKQGTEQSSLGMSASERWGGYTGLFWLYPQLCVQSLECNPVRDACQLSH